MGNHKLDTKGAEAETDEGVERESEDTQSTSVLDKQVGATLRTGGTQSAKKPGVRLGRDDIFAAMDGAKFVQPGLANARPEGPASGTETSLGGKLDQSTSAQQRDTRTPTKESMRARVDNTMQQYESRFAGGHRATTTNNAMMLAMAIQGAARVIADELYDPALEPKIAEQIAELYASELRASLPGSAEGPTYRKASLALAAVLVSDDPVSRYMHGEMRLDDAAGRIQKMAQAGNMTADRMFGLLREKWESELAAYTLEDVESREHNKGKAYSTREATGEMSTAYMKRLFPGLTTGAPPTTQQPKSKGLAFGPDATKMLTALEKAIGSTVTAPALVGGKVDGVDLTGKQVQHLKEVGEADQAVLSDRVSQCIDYLENTGISGRKLTNGEARKVVTKLQTGMTNLPLTVTVKGYEWFGEGKAVKDLDPVFQPGSSRRNETDMGGLVGKPGQNPEKLKYLGAWKGAADRGAEYLRFRTWKDQQMSSNLGFDDKELPAFGALNANWENTHGTGAYAGDLDAKHKEGTGQNIHQSENQGYGTNYYGDVHFMLDKSKVANRMVYTATDHGTPHKDPFLLLADILLGDGQGYKASKTGVEVNPIQHSQRAAMLVNAALGGDIQVQHELPFEIQIFGGLDLRRDVTAIHVSSNIPPLVAQRLMAAQNKLPVPIKRIEPPAPDSVKYSMGNSLFDQVHTLMKDEGK